MMKKIGIVGGVGPESTIYYYRTLIDLCRENKDLHGNYPEIIIYNLNFIEIVELARSNKEKHIDKVVTALESLHKAGADFGLIACNTIHMYFDNIQARSPLPLFSIVEETYKEVARYRLEKVGLLGTEKTMTARYYHDVFIKYGVSIAVPQKKERAYIGEKIMTELVSGTLSATTRHKFLEIAGQMKDKESIQGLILGCTELPLLITKDSEKVLGIPIFDTARIHARSALLYSLSS